MYSPRSTQMSVTVPAGFRSAPITVMPRGSGSRSSTWKSVATRIGTIFGVLWTVWSGVSARSA